MWLRDFVPSQIPSARAMSLGHYSLIAFSKSVAGIEDFAADLLNRLDNATKNARPNAGPEPFSEALTPLKYRNWTLCVSQETRNILCELNSELKLREQAQHSHITHPYQNLK